MDKSLLSKYTLSIVGGIAGGVIAYLFRPSSFMVGQLPFIHVISRGKTLKGLDQILIPVAETEAGHANRSYRNMGGGKQLIEKETCQRNHWCNS